MSKIYNWRADIRIEPESTLSHGVTPSGQESWQSENSDDTQTKTYTYWYRDSNTAYQGQYVDTISSRVAISVTDSWTTTVDNNNNLIITITTTVNSIVRDDLRGADQNLPGRNMTIYRTQGGAAVWTYQDTQVATAHTILSTPLSLGTETITIAPGDTSDIRSSIYFHNQTVGSSSYDDIWAGVQFRNPLPPDYIPGKIWNGSNWLSHNRATDGHAKIWNGSAWSDDMKTIDGGTATGDPPEIWHDSSTLKNMRKIGLNA